ncbi:uncharacterized protein LOC132699054 [Cylas formicarius]|uniref:uncharacterized protein LOC132699054 n=1 Tax=Cylas formicarius TaxID=197179 RepID=UPI002958A448|nr:uncharacterized protein LOC132699054 [Cylas formicarius]
MDQPKEQKILGESGSGNPGRPVSIRFNVSQATQDAVASGTSKGKEGEVAVGGTQRLLPSPSGQHQGGDRLDGAHGAQTMLKYTGRFVDVSGGASALALKDRDTPLLMFG